MQILLRHEEVHCFNHVFPPVFENVMTKICEDIIFPFLQCDLKLAVSFQGKAVD
jgi:hypothetical protein